MVKRGTFTLTILLSCGTSLLLLLVVLLFFPFLLVFVVYFLAFLPSSVPFGISEPSKLEQNFQRHRSALEAVVTTVRTEDLEEAKRGYWYFIAYKLAEPRGEEYRPLYRAMRQAGVQRVEVVREQPLTVRLITDEVPAMIDTNLYGYIYSANDRRSDVYGSYRRLAARWYLFEEIP